MFHCRQSQLGGPTIQSIVSMSGFHFKFNRLVHECVHILCTLRDKRARVAPLGRSEPRYKREALPPPLHRRVIDAVLSYRICGRTLVMFDSFILYSSFFLSSVLTHSFNGSIPIYLLQFFLCF